MQVKRWFDQIGEALQVMADTPRVLKLVWKSNPRLTVLLIAANILLGLAPLAEIWIIKLIIDTVATFIKSNTVEPEKQGYMLGLLGCLAAVRIVSNSMEPTVRLVQEQLGDLLVRDINLMILDKANSLVDISVFENPTFHDKLCRAQNEAGFRPLSILTNVTTGSRASVGLISMVCVLFAFQPFLALGVVLLALPNLIFQFKMQYETWAIQDMELPEVRRMRYFSEVCTRLDAASEIRLFNLGTIFSRKYVQMFDAFQAAHAKMRFRHWILNFMLANVAAFGLVGSYAYICFCALKNVITLGSLSLYISATSLIEFNLSAIIWSLAQLYNNNLFFKNMFEFMEVVSPTVLAAPDQAKLVPVPLQEGVKFENVSFRYPESDRDVFSNLNFELKAGQSVALVGENGAGKTTIVKLLSRLYEPNSGRILVDGVDLREYDLESWRSNLSVIFQNYARFYISARENIGVGNVALMNDMKRIEDAARRGGAASVIDKLPEKFDTTLGRWFSADKGTDLSGGEWQKIALSRAFMRSSFAGDSPDLKNLEAQLLILDEPTSALDAQAEYEVYLQFSELTRGKTTFLISHRFSTVKMADVVLVLDDGSIVESGSHEELIALGGEYSRLYNLQAERYK